MPIEASGATVEHPAGWMLLPASGSPPVVMFNLCDPAMTDGCLVRGEMVLSAPNPEVPEASLEARLASAKANPQLQPGSAEIQSGRYGAVETFWQGPHSSHSSKIVKRGSMQIQTPAGWYDCMLTADPALFETQVGQWRRFCASLDATAATDTNTHG